MTLLKLIQTLKECAKSHDAVKTIVDNDIYKLNDMGNVEYGVFAYTQSVHTTNIDSDTITYDLTLFFVDLLQEDLSNQIEIQSKAIEVLEYVLQVLYASGIVVFGDYSFQPFSERFSDYCSGCFVQARFVSPKERFC